MFGIVVGTGIGGQNVYWIGSGVLGGDTVGAGGSGSLGGTHWLHGGLLAGGQCEGSEQDGDGCFDGFHDRVVLKGLCLLGSVCVGAICFALFDDSKQAPPRYP